MRQSIVRITTHDTKKMYEFGADVDDSDRPPLWEATIAIKSVDRNGGTARYAITSRSVYLERETLQRAGLGPKKSEPEPAPEPVETAEDLLLRLLEVVGVYPEA